MNFSTENRKFNAIIVEDEEPAIEQMKRFLETRKEIELKDIARDGLDALEKINTKQFDLIFLDLNLPKLSGSTLIRMIANKPYFIVITSRKDKAIDSLDLGAVDYLLKPVYEDRFNNAIDKFLAVSTYQVNNSRVISFAEDHQLISLNTGTITHIEAMQRICIIHTDKKQYKTWKNLSDYATELKDAGFIQIHKKYLVNLQYARQLSSVQRKYQLLLHDSDDTELPVSRSYLTNLKAALGR